MLSRVADAIYWTSRYVERAENVARFVNVNLDLMLDSPTGQRPSWEPLVQTTGDQVLFEKNYDGYTPQNVTQFLTYDSTYLNSIFSSVRAARENARTVREVISREMWEALNALYLTVKEARKEQLPPEEMADFYENVKLGGIHFAGATDATLSHGEAWHFSAMGRMLERADKTSRILDVKYYVLLPNLGDVGTAIDQVGWTALLNSASALQMYRQRYHTITPKQVAHFLLFDANFPRSVRHCVHRMQRSLHNITQTPIGDYRGSAERLIGTLRSTLDYAVIDEVMDMGLHEYLDRLQKSLNKIGCAITDQFVGVESEDQHGGQSQSQTSD